MERTRDKIWENELGRKLVVIMGGGGGANGILQERGTGVQKQLEEGIRGLRTPCPKVHDSCQLGTRNHWAKGTSGEGGAGCKAEKYGS